VAVGDIHARSIEALDVSMPTVDVPRVSKPTFDLPAIDTAAADVPSIGASTVDLSKVATPKADMPGAGAPSMAMPGMEAPDVEIGGIPAPQVETPDWSLPAVSRPTTDLPGETLPEIDTPRADMLGMSMPGAGLEGDAEARYSIPEADVASRDVPNLEALDVAIPPGHGAAAEAMTGAAPTLPAAMQASAATDATSTTTTSSGAVPGNAGGGAALGATAAGAASQRATTTPGAESTLAPETPKDKTPVVTTSTGAVAISHIEYKGEEYAEITNSGPAPANLGGWVLRDQHDAEQLYRFAADLRLASGEKLRVYTAPGHQYSFNSKRSIMNDRGDAFELLDQGGQVVSTYAYGIDATEDAGKRPPVIDVVIAEVQYAGEEYVLITNKGTGVADLSGWKVRDQNDADQAYNFPAGATLANGATIRVYTAPGHQYSFNSNRPIWNNAGDALELLDAEGTVISTYAYGSYAQ
jgi:hypothetical protein